MNIFATQKLTHRLRKQAYGYQGESGWERNSLDQEDMYTLLYIKQISSRYLLHSTENAAKHLQ